ncbi:hypothetical protein [Sphingomonas oryzagri]
MSAIILAIVSSATETGPDAHLDAWDNEGGHQAHTSAGAESAEDTAASAEWDRLCFAEAELTKHFVEGRIGVRHNTYAHRMRYLGQDRARLQALALSDAGLALLNGKS